MTQSYSIHEISCDVCGNEFVDEGCTKPEFVRCLRQLGWIYGWDDENSVEGVICPDCQPEID